MPLSGFYFITDPILTRNGMLEDVAQALRARVAIVQYRDKGVSEPRPALARRMLELCRDAGVPFVVDDDVVLADSLGADGVHLGQTDTPASVARAYLGPNAIVGVSVATAAEVAEAELAGATYVAASPVFSTLSKPDAGPPIGLEGVRRIRAATRLPLAVIGGVHAGNAAALVRAGANLVCAISASLRGGTVEANVRALRAAMGTDDSEHRIEPPYPA
jgi:thiamine-phosphate pyrophosphorylase